jgi:tetratricopeptide (TPR) repeat protein
MSKKKSILLFAAILVALMLTSFCAAQVSPRDDDIQFRWRANLPEDVAAFAAGKMNGEPVLVVAANRSVYVFNKDGNPLFNTTIATKGKIYSIAVGDLDADGRGEIAAGVGWTEADDIDLDSKYPLPDGLPEEEKLLYRILKSKGAVYIIKDGKAAQLPGVDQWVRSIYSTDINGDKNNETVVVSGGFLLNYYKEYTDLILRLWVPRNTTFRVHGTPYTTKETCHCSDCKWDALDITKDCYRCYWNNITKVCTENHTIEHYQWNETEIKGWDLTESYSSNASIVVYDNFGKFISRSIMPAVNATFLNAQVVNLYHDNDEEVVLGAGGRIFVFRPSGSVISTYPFGGDIRYVYTADLSGSGNEDIVFEQKNKSGAYTIIAISREGKFLWRYSTNSTKDAPITYMKSVARNGVSEMMFSLSGTMYVIDSEGHLAWNYRLKYKGALMSRITMLFSTDLDSDGMEDIIFASNKMVYDYEVVGKFTDVQSAKKYFDLGNASYALNRYVEAKTYLEKAKLLYQGANYAEGISATDSLLNAVNSKLVGNRRTDAESQYAKALMYYSIRDYLKAKEYVTAAKTIYSEIGDAEGVSSCDSLAKTIDEILARGGTIATTTTSTYFVTTTAPSGPSLTGLLSENVLLILVLAILIVMGAMMMRRREKPKAKKKLFGLEISEKKEHGGKKVEIKLKGEPISEEGLKKDWNALEEKWKKMEES